MSTSSRSEQENKATSVNSPIMDPLSESRCIKCSLRRNVNSRNLVVCIDGTSNHFGKNNTNVVKLFAKIDLETGHPQPRQFAYYSSGIGTRPKPLHVFNRMERAVSDKFDMAIAWNVEEIVKDAYGWLARMYQEGDQIYLFGFSRGAYQVRVLAGMIREVGLIRTPTEKQVGTAWDYYKDIRSGKPKPRQIAREFKNTFSWKDLRVHFVGVWDTVSSVGLVREDVFLSTSASAAHACHFRHALALDELRVKFMPEYFHEMNSQGGGEDSEDVSKYVVQKKDETGNERPPSEDSQSTMAPVIKEVWFAGTHSDVGGTNRPGKSYQAGNVSLLWMRREAAACGLVLKPTDIVWVPGDLDFGTINSMTRIWRMVEYLPITHQVSFSGAGENARRWHRLHPRRIIPGQKVHASILYANAYKPRATLGNGFDIPVVHATSAETDLDESVWDTGMFDATAAKELLACLSAQQGVAPIYLDRLLFMLRFKEGRESVRLVPGWRETFETLIGNRSGLVRLVTVVAYYEAAYDEGSQSDASSATTKIQLCEEMLDDAKASFTNILSARRHRDCVRVIALLRPLARHPDLRRLLLTPDVLHVFMELLDQIINHPRENFTQAMDSLNCLLHHEELQGTLIGHLDLHPHQSRLVRMLSVTDLHHLTACLRVVITLSQIERARNACAALKPRLRQLAGQGGNLVGTLATEALVILYDPNDEEQLNVGLVNPNFRANLASTLLRFNPKHNCTSADGNEFAGHAMLRELFGLDANSLSEPQKKLIKELRLAVETGKAHERTASTMTLLKLCETPVIRTYLREIDLLNVFVDQLQYKGSALLAAYGLATCLKYNDMKESVKDNQDLPKYIVGMLKLDYFDDAIGQVEGFQIFGDIMQHVDLREKIKDYNITEVLNTKLAAGKPKEIRTSLICLDIFRSFDPDGPWTRGLVTKSLDYLRNPEWQAQKAGVTILSALAHTDHGAVAIKDRIPEVVEMLLPAGYSLIASTGPAMPRSTTMGEMQARGINPLQLSRAQTMPPESPSKSPSSIFGPACALRILAQNKMLRERTRDTLQYGNLKHLHLSGNLVDETETPAWRVKTPIRADAVDMIDKMIKAVDEELLEEGLISIGDTVLPHIQHWDRLATLVRDRSIATVTILPLVLGISALTIVGVAVITPIYLSFVTYKFFRRLVGRYQHSRVLARLRECDPTALHDGGGHESNHGEIRDGQGAEAV